MTNYTYEEQVEIELTRRGIVGKENQARIVKAKEENVLMQPLWDKTGESKSILSVLLELVGAGKEE